LVYGDAVGCLSFDQLFQAVLSRAWRALAAGIWIGTFLGRLESRRRGLWKLATLRSVSRRTRLISEIIRRGRALAAGITGLMSHSRSPNPVLRAASRPRQTSMVLGSTGS